VVTVVWFDEKNRLPLHESSQTRGTQLIRESCPCCILLQR
jgi:hypothetical protein